MVSFPEALDRSEHGPRPAAAAAARVAPQSVKRFWRKSGTDSAAFGSLLLAGTNVQRQPSMATWSRSSFKKHLVRLDPEIAAEPDGADKK